MRYSSTKTYGHEIGFSCAFRQWRATSHCRLLHGYAISFRFEFEAETLDDRNWVVDFGGLKSLKAELEKFFDHATVVAEDDPQREWFEEGARRGLLRLVVVRATGCEAFAEFALGVAQRWLEQAGHLDRVRIREVEVREHGANGASIRP